LYIFINIQKYNNNNFKVILFLKSSNKINYLSNIKKKQQQKIL